ncbi:MAG: putative maturation protein [Apeevirus fundihabitans]|uniref:Maturation protein n=1 Tax=Leviviridae sp. TaxID=2027243 RepID=A0ABY3SSI1_9VIRU|nr:MAG: putative maturation protein [Leviviridae sp.]
MPFQIEKSIDSYTTDIAMLQPRHSSSGDYAATGPASSVPASAFPQTLRDAVFERTRSTMNARRNVVGPKWAVSPSGGSYYTGYANPVGLIPPKPADDVAVYEVDKVKSVNGNFEARKKAGEIVVAPYSSEGFIKVKRVAGMKDISSSYLGDHWLAIGLAGSAGFTVSGERWYFTPRLFIEPWNQSIYRITLRKYQSDWVVPNFFSPTYLYDQMKTYVPPPDVITQVWADNNQKRLDFLTTMAEAPKTLESILDGFGYLASFIRDLKRGRIYANKSYQRQINELGKDIRLRKAEIVSSFDQKLSRARTTAAILKLQYRKRKAIDRLERYQKRKNKQMYRELTTTLSSLWLQFRYEVMPLVYTAEDALAVIANSTSEYITSREAVNLPLTLTPDLGWGLNQSTVVIPRSLKVFIKSRLRPENGYSKTMSMNPFSTAWELLTLSFVVDWFVNIGDAIAAYTGGFSDTSGATTSIKLDTRQIFTLNGVNGAYVELSANFYTRSTIDPRLCGGLVIRPELNLFRYLDAMSLAWSRSRFKISRAN